jgi:hypothetical protein
MLAFKLPTLVVDPFPEQLAILDWKVELDLTG